VGLTDGRARADLGELLWSIRPSATLYTVVEHTTTELQRVPRRDRLGGLIHEYQQVAEPAPSCWHPPSRSVTPVFVRSRRHRRPAGQRRTQAHHGTPPSFRR
jgi:hypothetical protein